MSWNRQDGGLPFGSTEQLLQQLRQQLPQNTQQRPAQPAAAAQNAAPAAAGYAGYRAMPFPTIGKTAAKPNAALNDYARVQAEQAARAAANTQVKI